MALLSNPRGGGEEPLPNAGVTTAFPARQAPAAPPPHLTLELALLLEAEVFRGVGHHGEGLLGVVSAGQKKKLGVTLGNGQESRSFLQTSDSLLATSSYPWEVPAPAPGAGLWCPLPVRREAGVPRTRPGLNWETRQA